MLANQNRRRKLVASIVLFLFYTETCRLCNVSLEIFFPAAMITAKFILNSVSSKWEAWFWRSIPSLYISVIQERCLLLGIFMTSLCSWSFHSLEIMVVHSSVFTQIHVGYFPRNHLLLWTSVSTVKKMCSPSHSREDITSVINRCRLH